MCKKCYCNMCGNLVEEHNIRVVKHNHTDLEICKDCYDNGYLWHGEEYVVCNGCTDEPNRFCWVKIDDLINVGDQLICRDYLIGNFDECPKCGEYIFCMNNECTNCGYNSKEGYCNGQ